MAQTKIKKDLIDASFGNILEQIAYVADGRTLSTSAGNITVPNVTAKQDISGTTYVDLTGTNIDYTPPSGATSVLYEVLFSYAYNALGSSGYLSPFVRVALDGTVINSSRKGHLWNSGWDAEMRIAIPIQIVGASDDIANMKVASWGSARTIKTQISTYNAGNYRFASHYNYYGPGSSVQYVVPPFIKITAYS
tara:strand:+ start:254 stop:832 length:579 start_codon:yes stop_codon:yes gene_type:complete